MKFTTRDDLRNEILNRLSGYADTFEIRPLHDAIAAQLAQELWKEGVHSDRQLDEALAYSRGDVSPRLDAAIDAALAVQP